MHSVVQNNQLPTESPSELKDNMILYFVLVPEETCTVCLQVLIFSQMTKLLDLLEYYLGERGHNPCRIDGAVAQSVRQQQVCCKQSNLSVFELILHMCMY